MDKLAKPSKPLCLAEWIVFSVAFGGLLAILALGAKSYFASGSSYSFERKRPSIIVSLEGAVKKRGCFTLPEGSLFADLLRLAEPLEESDLSKFSRDQVLKDGQKIRVPKRKIRKRFAKKESA